MNNLSLNKLGISITAILGSGLIVSCSPNKTEEMQIGHTEKIVRSLPEANGYDVRMDRSNALKGYTEIFVNGGQFKDYKGYLYARDNESDGRFDEIKLVNVPKGSELESLATINKVAKITQAVENYNFK